MTLGFWDKLTGVCEHPAYCPRCGIDVAPWKTNRVIYKFECPTCKKRDIVTLKELPKMCLGSCGTPTSKWKCDGPVDADERIPGEFCQTCLVFVKSLDQEVKKGGIPWVCMDCMATGVEKADSEFSRNVRKEYPEGVMVQFSRKNCPLCGMLSRMEN